MSVADRIPYDFLGNTGYRFWVQRLPNTSFSIQKIVMPGLTLPMVPERTPFVDIPKAGDKISYNELVVEYIVDEQLANYMDVYNWIVDLGKPVGFWQYRELVVEPGTGVASDLLLTILDAKKNPKLKVTFHNAIPISLSDLVFESTAAAPDGFQYLTVTAKFAYTSFDVSSDL